MATRQKQAGISYIGVMVLILIIGSLLKVVSAVGPAYYDYYTIDKIIESLYRDGRTTTSSVPSESGFLSMVFAIDR